MSELGYEKVTDERLLAQGIKYGISGVTPRLPRVKRQKKGTTTDVKRKKQIKPSKSDPRQSAIFNKDSADSNTLAEQKLSGSTATSFKSTADVMHSGGCHCGAVRFTVQAPADLHVYDCNCSVCTKKGNKHFIVPASKFHLTQGDEYLTVYRFNSMKAEHKFCRICGVQSFYKARSNENGYGIMPHCLDSGTVKSTKIMHFDGDNWEQTMEKEREKTTGSILDWSN